MQRAILAILFIVAAADAGGQPVEQFFARKSITIVIGYTAGGSYDLLAVPAAVRERPKLAFGR